MADEIKITPEMIEAGMNASPAMAFDYRGEEKVALIYRAMEAARKASGLTVTWRESPDEGRYSKSASRA